MRQSVMEMAMSAPMMIMRIFCRCPIPCTPCSIVAVLPKNVCLPVNSTVASVSPRVTVDPILALSPRYMVTGRDSPVSADWSISRRPSLSRQSAGTLLPAPSSTRSPGTKSDASQLAHLPSRLTVAVGLRLAFSAATASAALIVSYLFWGFFGFLVLVGRVFLAHTLSSHTHQPRVTEEMERRRTRQHKLSTPTHTPTHTHARTSRASR